MSDSRLRLGVIGAGLAFRHLHLPQLARHRDRVEVAAVATRSRKSAEAARDLTREATGDEPRVFASARELIASAPDAVLVTVPIAATHEVAHAVLEAGIDLICEKPIGESAQEAESLARRAERRGVVFAVCENFRYQRRFWQAHELVGDGAIGDPKVYFLNDLHHTPPDGVYSTAPWRQRGDHRGGYLLDGGTHIVAGMRVMVGATPREVHALPASFHPGRLRWPWDTALANLTFDGGFVGHLALGHGSPDREGRHPKILGTEGTLVLKRDRIEIWRSDPARDTTIELEDRSDGVEDEWNDFVLALTEGTELRFGPWEAVADLAVLDAVIESGTEGRPAAVRAARH
jgi:predicted dehydrogenase